MGLPRRFAWEVAAAPHLPAGILSPYCDGERGAPASGFANRRATQHPVQEGRQEVRTAKIVRLARRQPRHVLHDERRTLNSERTRCPTSMVLFPRWPKRWKNAAIPT
ncbi:MAG: hypothetical protein E5W88_19450 [Mesorhizobium sp.]|nr:MAG: hypothetical protein E5W88_19450 [Mesorhizobium sp.]